MEKKTIVFIETAAKIANVFENQMKIPLMGTFYLGTILHNAGYSVRILNENILGKEVDPFSISADVFCITALTITCNPAKLLASNLRRIYPNSKIIIGGIHASLLPEEFTDVADHVVLGEAEDIIIDLVEGKFTEKIVHGNKVADLNALPPVNYKLLEHYENLNVIPIMTSRGCPFDCNFCTVTKVFGRHFRMQTPERIVAEIENALASTNDRTFFFYDDNFTANPKRMHELCDLLIEKKLNISWSAQVRSDIARDPELVQKMAKAGCYFVFIGFESIDDEALKAMHKSQTRSDIEKAIRVIHTYGIGIHGMFMFGDDHCTTENITNTVNFAMQHDIDTVQFMILTPFPGTQIYDQIVSEKRLFHRDWDYYNAMFIVFQPKLMSAANLQSETTLAYGRFYSLWKAVTDAVWLIINVFLDALVWNFRNANRYNLKSMVIRAAAGSIVSKYSHSYDTYAKYLKDIERKQILSK